MDALLTLVSKPSGTLVAVKKVTVTKRPATTERAFDVLFSQFHPCSTSFWWFLGEDLLWGLAIIVVEKIMEASLQ